MSPTADVVERGDLDELTRHVDRLADDGAWEELVVVRDLCRKALERGKQLWPAASYAEYRVALGAPAPIAAQMLVEGTGRFALGPLPEVVAATHTWAELAPYVPHGPVAALAAHERVVRGEDVSMLQVPEPNVLEIAFVLQPWEPAYPLAQYHPDEAEFPTPPMPRLEPATLGGIAATHDDPDVTRALLDLVTPWTTESNGRAEAIAATGSVEEVIAALGVRRIRVAEVSLADALAHMAWAAASGGAQGRRRGMASGRFAAWWALAAVCGLLDEWPADPVRLADAAAGLTWYLWDAGEPNTGWSLRIAVQSAARKTHVLSASDSA